MRTDESIADVSRASCAGCLNVPDLWAFVRRDAERRKCSYCGKRRLAVPVDSIADHVECTLKANWTDAENYVPFESAEGGFQWSTKSVSEIIRYNLLDSCETEELLDDVCRLIDDGTVYDDSGFLADDRIYEWNGFCEYVKHNRRFTAFLEAEHDMESEANRSDQDLLKNIAELLSIFDLVRHVEKGELRVHRARRYQNDFDIASAVEFGPPPLSRCVQANRMSPPGIPVLYCSESRRTAVSELRARIGEKVAVAELQNSQRFYFLDLCSLPSVRSIWDYEYTGERVQMEFIHEFTSQLSLPIARDQRAHIDYIPTQLAAEFLRVLLNVQAIRFPSIANGGVNWAIYVYSNKDEESIFFPDIKFADQYFDLMNAAIYELVDARIRRISPVSRSQTP